MGRNLRQKPSITQFNFVYIGSIWGEKELHGLIPIYIYKDNDPTIRKCLARVIIFYHWSTSHLYAMPYTDHDKKKEYYVHNNDN